MTNKKQNNAPLKKWCFLTYIAGDNNLSNAGLKDIIEMCEEGASSDIYIGVEIDTYGEHTGSIRYEIPEADWSGMAYRKVIERLQERDSGSPKTIKSFLKWGFNRYRAEDYVVVIWSHGSGFRAKRKNIAYDDFGSSLNMSEIEWAIRKSGIAKDEKIKILGFDACLMSMLEIAYHFKDQVEIIVGSQQTEPADGWPYNKVIHEIKEAQCAHSLAKSIVHSYIKSYKNTGIQNLTQSAIDTQKVDRAFHALDALSKLLIKHINDIRGQLIVIRYTIQYFDMADYVDAIHFAELIAEQIMIPEIQTAALTFMEQTQKCIIANKTKGFQLENANGLSLWFPGDAPLYFNNRAEYTALKFAKTYPNWVQFLDEYFYRMHYNV
ncbi:clostripain-related cysteine peptidase [Aureispira anguillae]|uniref:Clostripain-related cysteine peptidase n=1 Tax=Aureispira anguillae TaxID=2864201 RepID=A0A916DSW6_9BACT|nr:clostripain-related cysteine peptidase [Aureispira anguillae]BDS11337.1 clostripain-related cysteine peptidase [Aureispira anguillae]